MLSSVLRTDSHMATSLTGVTARDGGYVIIARAKNDPGVPFSAISTNIIVSATRHSRASCPPGHNYIPVDKKGAQSAPKEITIKPRLNKLRVWYAATTPDKTSAAHARATESPS